MMYGENQGLYFMLQIEQFLASYNAIYLLEQAIHDEEVQIILKADSSVNLNKTTKVKIALRQKNYKKNKRRKDSKDRKKRKKKEKEKKRKRPKNPIPKQFHVRHETF